MSLQPPLPKRQAIVMVRDLPDGEARPSLNFDPIYLPVELSTRGLVADVFDNRLMNLVDAIAPLDGPSQEYRLVWFDGESNVMGMCPLCDKVFVVARGLLGDEHNEGVRAVTCGCWDG